MRGWTKALLGTTLLLAGCGGGGGGGAESDPIPTPPPVDMEAPSSPANLGTTAVTSNSISLQWDAATDNVGVTGYRVSRNGQTIATVVSTSYNDSGLQPSTSYDYSVQALDAAGNESAASTINVVTNAPPPDPTAGWPTVSNSAYSVKYPPNYEANEPMDGQVLFAESQLELDGDPIADIRFFALPIALSAALDLIRPLYLQDSSYLEQSIFVADLNTTQISGTMTNDMFGWGGDDHTYIVISRPNGAVLEIDFDSENPSLAEEVELMLSTLELF